MVRKEFIRHAERHQQVRLAGSIDFRAESSPSPPPTLQRPQPQQSPLPQSPQAELAGLVTQSLDEVKVWVSSMLLRSGGGFDKGVYQEMLTALRPRTPYLHWQLNTVLILPDGDDAIMRGMFELFMELSKAGSILRVRVLFPDVHVLIQDATSD